MNLYKVTMKKTSVPIAFMFAMVHAPNVQSAGKLVKRKYPWCTPTEYRLIREQLACIVNW